MKKTQICINDLFFELNLSNLTAEITYSPRARSNIYIPRAINYLNQEFIITKIQKGSFETNLMINSIDFSKDSSLFSIEKNAFKNSNITKIRIPDSVETLEDGWCNATYELKKVIISTQNPNFKYADENRHILIGKSDKRIANFNVLVFAKRSIRRVKIPVSITRISPYAFDGCFQLKCIEIPENSILRSIGKKAFSYSSIKNIFIPPYVELLEDGWCSSLNQLQKITISPNNSHFKYADDNQQVIVGKSDKNSSDYDVLVFANRNIRSANIPCNIKYIASYAFNNCSVLNHVEIPNNSLLQSIGKEAFAFTSFNEFFIPPKVNELQKGWCKFSKIERIILSPNNKCFKYLDENEQIIIGKSDIESNIYDTLVFASNSITSITIPSFIKNIGPYAFFFCKNLTSIKIPDNSELKTIGQRAFSYSNIFRITIPSSVEIIGSDCFSSCENLEEVIFEDFSKVTSILSGTFSHCDSLQKIDFSKCKNLKKICEASFNSSLINDLIIPSNVEKLEDGFLYSMSCSLTIHIKDINNNINIKYADENKNIIVGKSNINNQNYDVLIHVNHNLKNLKIPSFIKYIDYYFFDNNYELESVEIVENSELTYLGNCFSSSSFSSLTIPSTVEVIEERWCYSSSKLVNVILSPKNKNYKYADENHQIIIGKSNSENEEYDVLVFASRNIEKVIIPSYIKHINSYAFKYCKQLKTVEFEENSQLKSIGSSAFVGTAIISITIPKSVEKMKSSFYNCEQIQTFELESGSKLRSLKRMFHNCFNLKNVKIPEECSLKYIRSKLFEDKKSNDIYIPSSVEMLEDDWYLGISNVILSPNNPHFKYADYEKHVILGKSDKNNSEYDVLTYVNPNTKCLTIPENIMINKFAFSKSHSIKNLEFLGKVFSEEFDFFNNWPSLQIVSMPNIKEITIKIGFLSNYSLFVPSKTKILGT